MTHFLIFSYLNIFVMDEATHLKFGRQIVYDKLPQKGCAPNNATERRAVSLRQLNLLYSTIMFIINFLVLR